MRPLILQTGVSIDGYVAASIARTLERDGGGDEGVIHIYRPRSNGR